MIAIPSVTGVSNRAKEKQLKKDAEMFKALVEVKISKDTSIEIASNEKACFTLRSIDSNSLSGNYDNNSFVMVGSCHYATGDRYICDDYSTTLVASDYKNGYENGSFLLPPIKIGQVCNGNEWCICNIVRIEDTF